MMTARSDLAEAIKGSLTMDEVARRYGFEPNRAGFIRCPFHRERTASLKIYPGGKGWHCFGCNRGGSVIDFVMELYGIGFAQAVVRLNADFALGLTGERPSPAQRAKILEERRRAAARAAQLEQEYRILAREHLYWHEAEVLCTPSREAWEAGAIHPLYVDAVKRLPELEWEIEEWEAKYGRSKNNSHEGGAA